MKTLAVQLPAPCPLNCAFCRTPEHRVGNSVAVCSRVFESLGGVSEVYLTSNGETGLFPGYRELVAKLTRKTRVAILGATDRSVVPGISRAEISVNRYTEPLAVRAIAKANGMGIPVVASLVDDGDEGFDLSDLPGMADRLGVDAVLVRALQAEGRSARSGGISRSYVRDGTRLGNFPVACYKELEGMGGPVESINHNGNIVPFLGGV